MNNSYTTHPYDIARLVLSLVLMIACSIPTSVLALGVLEPQLKSYINEKLEVEIPLILSQKEKDDDILVRQIVNKDRNISEWVPELSFRLVTDVDNNFTIVAKSSAVVNEPIVHFTISIKTRYNWIQREMSFLMDPRPMKALMTPRAASPEKEVVLKPSEAQPQKQPAPDYREPVAPSYAAPVEQITESTSSYMVKSGDSVSLIARKFRNVRNASAQQVMVSIFNANPQAFINNDINKIKSHVEIVIPDDAEMQKLSATEARQVFSMLLAGEQAPPEPARAMPAPEVAAPEAPETAMAPAPAPAAPAPAAREPEEVISQPQALPVEEPAEQQKDFELTLAPDDTDMTETAIQQNEGTIVYETLESAAEKAGEPSETMKQNIKSAVTDMEEQLTTLREEIKRLQQTLAEKEKQQAVTADSIAGTQAQIDRQAATAEDSGPVEMETPAASQDGDSSFDYMRLLIEIITLGAAGGFIGYFIALRRKRASGVVEDEDTDDSSYIRPIFSSDKGKGQPEEKRSTYAPSPAEHTVVGKEGIEVSDANVDEYDESVKRRETRDLQPPEESSDEEEVNPEYILQEANLSIAFSDLDNAYHLLMKLINHEPRNPEYRVLILGVLKDLLKEGEFIFHANHLADITGKSPDNSHWQKAVELGQAFIPEHELFQFNVDNEITDVNPALQESPSVNADDEQDEAQDEMYTTGTIVMKSEDALAEHERQMQLKTDEQQPENAGVEETQDSKPEPLSFDELMDDIDSATKALRDEQTQLSEFRQEKGVTEQASDDEAETGQEVQQPEPLSFDELLDADADESSTGKDEEHILEYDGDPFSAQSGPSFSDSESGPADSSGEDPYKSLEDEIKSDSLVGGDKKKEEDSDDYDEDTTVIPKPKRD